MPTMDRRCKECGSIYTIDVNESDDGYCSFECWESNNCDAPKAPTDVFEADVKELINDN